MKKQAIPYIYLPAEEIGLRAVKEFNDKLGLCPDRPIKEGYLPIALYSFPNVSDGLVRISVRQLSCFVIMYLNDGNYNGKQILQKTTVDTMLFSDHFGRGLCWYTEKTKDGRVFWTHGG